MFLILLLSSVVHGEEPKTNWAIAIEKTKNYYKLNDLYEKKVNNKGEGFEPLSDLRNFRVVLHGVLYRSGANNVYSKKNKRENENPLPAQGLKALCEQNFSTVFYLYKKNYDSNTKDVSCKDNAMTYQQLSGLDAKNEYQFLETIFKNIKQRQGKPILVHCWNGWHASGYIATLALRQFCHFDKEEAKAYWIKNTDGNSKGYDKLVKRIQSFEPKKEFKISDEVMTEICPVVGSAKN